jgi:MFS family permease
MVSTLALAPLTIYFGHLSDRIGRRRILLAGLLLGAVSIVPVFSGLLHFGNPALQRFSREVPVILSGDACSYSPFRQARNDCERNQEFLTKHGVAYTLQTAPAGHQAVVSIPGVARLAGYYPEELTVALKASGWTEQAEPPLANLLLLALLLLIPAIAVALITGPQTAVLAERVLATLLLRCRTTSARVGSAACHRSWSRC